MNHAESADMYAQFAETAQQNEYAWNYGKGPATSQTIGTVDSKNRMICFPCGYSQSSIEMSFRFLTVDRPSPDECVQYRQSISSMHTHVHKAS